MAIEAPEVTTSCASSDAGPDRAFGFGERPAFSPTEEEQEWLDEQMAEVDEQLWNESPFEHRERSETAGSEDEFVQQMMLAHPNLDAEEARWLFARQRSPCHGGFW